MIGDLIQSVPWSASSKTLIIGLPELLRFLDWKYKPDAAKHILAEMILSGFFEIDELVGSCFSRGDYSLLSLRAAIRSMNDIPRREYLAAVISAGYFFLDIDDEESPFYEFLLRIIDENQEHVADIAENIIENAGISEDTFMHWILKNIKTLN